MALDNRIQYLSMHVIKTIACFTWYTCSNICNNVGWITILGIFLFSLTRLHMLHTTVVRLQSERENEAWLFEQCKRDDFYHNLRQHSNLCDDVNARAQDAVILHAMREVIENTYICQFEFCMRTLHAVANFCTQHFFYVSIISTIIFLLAPSLFLPHWRRCMNVMTDNKTRQLYHCPYGDLHYVGTHSSDYDFQRLEKQARGKISNFHI